MLGYTFNQESADALCERCTYNEMPTVFANYYKGQTKTTLVNEWNDDGTLVTIYAGVEVKDTWDGTWYCVSDGEVDTGTGRESEEDKPVVICSHCNCDILEEYR